MKGQPVNAIAAIATGGFSALSAGIAGKTYDAVQSALPQFVRGVAKNAAIPIATDNALTVAWSAFQDLLIHMVLDPIIIGSSALLMIKAEARRDDA
jgi:hypothetical protein